MLTDFRPFQEPLFLIAIGAAALLLGTVGLVARMAQ
jgi:hypothetical protein